MKVINRRNIIYCSIRYFILTGLVFLYSISSSSAQVLCKERSILLKSLTENYAEHGLIIGITSNGNVLEFLVSADGTWTILITRPNGISCVASVGKDFEIVLPKEKGKELKHGS